MNIYIYIIYIYIHIHIYMYVYTYIGELRAGVHGAHAAAGRLLRQHSQHTRLVPVGLSPLL